MKVKILHNPEIFCKRLFWLLWQACGKPFGMGILKDRPNATEDEVWDNIKNSGDYIGNIRHAPSNVFYADYVFGRMMKINVRILDSHNIEIDDGPYDIEYQMWSDNYPTPQSIVEAVNRSLL